METYSHGGFSTGDGGAAAGTALKWQRSAGLRAETGSDEKSRRRRSPESEEEEEHVEGMSLDRETEGGERESWIDERRKFHC